MIKSLVLKNFQSHKKTELELDPGVNAIVGPSDSGKSSILRGLRWLMTNRPTGEAFRSHWGGETGVVLFLENEKVVSRFRGKSTNAYRILERHPKDVFDSMEMAQNMEGVSEFVSFGQDVPEPVLELLNMGDINTQSQHDRHFLLSESSAEVARILNEVANLEDIDIAASWNNGEIRKISDELKRSEIALFNQQTDLEKYDYLDEIEPKLKELETKEKKRQELLFEKAKMSLCVAQISSAHKEITEIENHLAILEKYEGVFEKKERLETIQDEKNSLSFKIAIIEEAEETIEQCNKLITLEPNVEKLHTMALELVRMETEHDAIYRAILKIEETEAEIASHTFNIGDLEREFKELMPDICPLCGK